MKKNIPFLTISYWLLAIGFSGCTPQQKLQHLENRHPELFKPTIKDSISNTVQYVAHDSIISIPAQSVTLHDTFLVNEPCPTHYRKVLKSGNETATLSIDSGMVTVICHEDSLKKEIEVRDKIISSFKEHTQVGVAEHDVYLTLWYDYFCRTIVGLSLLFLLLWVLLHALKLPLP
ncbi:MAG TPA: hypothetical protein VK809_11830 [Bacteroidia bacterium]|nr:hypothetical protein [Bacteroidia bacterium]